jgi:hypothetical protein
VAAWSARELAQQPGPLSSSADRPRDIIALKMMADLTSASRTTFDLARVAVAIITAIGHDQQGFARVPGPLHLLIASRTVLSSRAALSLVKVSLF